MLFYAQVHNTLRQCRLVDVVSPVLLSTKDEVTSYMGLIALAHTYSGGNEQEPDTAAALGLLVQLDITETVARMMREACKDGLAYLGFNW